jgi:tetratricopeptide (TPR) repeat protein
VALLHSFAFPQAVEEFNAALKADPTCAIAYWGLALAAWGNPFAAGIKPDAQLQRGLDAVQRGRAIDAATERERGYLMAASRLYENARTVDQRTRMLAYRDAMASLSARHPDDPEASIFYALALAFSADPADKSYASQLKAGAILEKLAVSQPNHPGLAHYIIHSYDVPALAPRALTAARRYARIARSASHALHMPSHTFTRLGYWQESIQTNIASAAAARREGSTAEELHASDYLMYAYLQTGQDRAARRLIAALPEVAARFDPSRAGSGAPPAAGYFAMAALPARYALERGAWREAAALEVRQSPFPYADAMTHFARAFGAARIRDTAASAAAIAELRRMHDQLVQQHENYWSGQVDIQQRTASAWLALAEGRIDDALSGMRDAAEREDATDKSVVTPGPLAPAHELLGEMLLELNRPEQALTEFQRTLESEPNRFRTLVGAAKAARAAGNRAAVRQYARQLMKICVRADRPGRPELVEARASLSGAR